MNDKIMQWSNKEIYNGILTSHPSVEKILLKDKQLYPYLDDEYYRKYPLQFVNTDGYKLKEQRKYNNNLNKSTSNKGEARLIINILKHMCKNGIKDAKHIGVITPYKA